MSCGMNASRMIGSPNSVFNLDWSGYAKSSDVEKSVNKIAGSVDKATEKMTGKLATDLQRGMEKIVSATKDGAEKVCDTVKRTATTNAADNSQTIPLAVKAIHKGLMDVSETTARIAEHLIDHPDEMRGATEAAESIGKRFSELVEAVSQYDQGTSKLKGMVGEMAKTADWIDYRFSHAESNQSGMAVPSVSVNNTFCGRIFNAGATAPPCVGDFNELFGYNR